MKQIIEKYLSGSCTPSEQYLLLEWMRVEKNRKEFQAIKKAWLHESATREMPDEYQKSWARLQQHLLSGTHSELQKSKRHLQLLRYAAAVLLLASLIGTGGFFLDRYTHPQETVTTVVAEPGQISKVLLPDNSEVWINSGSSVSYNNRFGLKNRNIQLNGEAFFKVTHNEDLPLTVNTPEMRVTVLGTEFSVTNYPENQNMQVILEKGEVCLAFPGSFSGSYTLKPGELANYSKTDKKLTIRNVNTDLYTSWKEGTINIYNLPLEEVAKRLEKRYNQKFVVDEKIRKTPYTFTVKNEPLSNILKLMEQITPVKVVQKGDSIFLGYKEK